MTKLVLGMESIEVKTAKKRVVANLQMLNERIQGLCKESASYGALNSFYHEKIEQQKGLLEWLGNYDGESLLSDGVACD